MNVRPLALALALTCGCVDDSVGDDAGGMCFLEDAALIEGELITWGPFGHDFSEYCSGGFDIAEDHARWVAAAWGTEPREFDYGVYESRDHPCWPCADRFVGCVIHGFVASTDVPHRHEIAHAVRGGSCHSLIEEGWAMVYGDHFENAMTDGDIRLAVADTDPGLKIEHYPIAARFVAFLLETRGVEQLRALCDTKARRPEEFEAAVLDTYGMEFEQLAAEFDTYPEHLLGHLRQDQACEGDDVLVAPTEWDFTLECGAADCEGRRGVTLQTQRLLELPQGGGSIVFESPSNVEVNLELRNCAREGGASVYYQWYPFQLEAGIPYPLSAFTQRPPGTYVVRLQVVGATQATTVRVRIND